MSQNQFKTPLRYPGGKQRLAPFINEILSENNITGHYAEPYAGGAGIGIELLLTKKIEYIHLNDSDFGVYAFWHSILNRTEEFCKLIACASLTVDEWRRHKQIVAKSDRRKLLELGFSVFFLNRCNRSGVLRAGVIGGINQNGNYKMDARFSRNDLIRRIEAIALFKKNIFVTNFDAEFYIANYIPHLPKNSLIYLDPPYFVKGSDLYLNHYKKEDHTRIAEAIQDHIKHRWILSYDGVKEILNLYKQRRHFRYDLQYTAAKVYKGKEVFVFSDRLRLPHDSSLPHISMGMKKVKQYV